MIEETNNKQLSEKYVYYRTIPVLNDWITLKKYIPETYYNFFEEDGRHYDYDEFVSKYNEDKGLLTSTTNQKGETTSYTYSDKNDLY